jgi:hypothetical protein
MELVISFSKDNLGLNIIIIYINDQCNWFIWHLKRCKLGRRNGESFFFTQEQFSFVELKSSLTGRFCLC